jgi:endonuclease/exonuclease/phosphatase family metal-dependent hydrolase
VVIAGDFNCELGSPEMSAVTARYDDVYHAVHPKESRTKATTYNPRFGVDPGVIDHIFVERHGAKRLIPLASEVILNSVGPDSVWASDHFGVVARLGQGR